MPTRTPHDFRRTAIHNLERSGVPRSAAMAVVGHQTEAVYRRYAIVEERKLTEAGAELQSFFDNANVAPRPVTRPAKARAARRAKAQRANGASPGSSESRNTSA